MGSRFSLHHSRELLTRVFRGDPNGRRATGTADSTSRTGLIVADGVSISSLYDTCGAQAYSLAYNSPVTITWKTDDAESGIASSSGCDVTTLTNETMGTTLTCIATNGAGLTNSNSVTIKIDQTPPVVTYSGPTAYTLDQLMSVTCSASDPLHNGVASGIASTTCANVAGPAWSFGPGSHSYSAQATDNAGNSTLHCAQLL